MSEVDDMSQQIQLVGKKKKDMHISPIWFKETRLALKSR